MAEIWCSQKLDLNSVDAWPGSQATLIYGDITVKELGQAMTPTQVQNQPKVEWDSSGDKLYTIAMVDPDAPSKKDQSWGQWFHWGVINIPGNLIDKGEVIAEYVGAGPPKDTGLHRYIFIIYEQPGKIKYNGKKLELSPDGRSKNCIKNMHKEHGFGKPVAGACYQAEYDDYVPTLYKKIGA